MDAPPVNRLLQLLRQKPSEPSEPSHSRQTRVSPGESAPQSISQSNTLPATESDTQGALQRDIQTAPKVADSLLKVTHCLLPKVTHK
jgi:hypothetical protein